MSRTYRTVNRFFGILTLLERAPHGLTVSDVYKRLEKEHPADERTYRRDLENLEYLGFIAAFDDTSSDTLAARYKATRNLQVSKSLNLELRELFALYVGRNMLAPLRETPFFDDLQRVFQKIEKILGPKCQEHLIALSSEVHFEPGPRWGLGIHPDVLDVVERCCAEGHVFTAKYDSVNSGEERQRTFGPHFLYFAKGSLYLVAEDLEEKRVKVFALPRMSKPVMSEQQYAGEKVDPESYFESAFSVFRGEPIEHIELLFHPPHSASVRERRWHSSQRVIPCAKGSVRLTLDVAITPELVQWVLSFADGVHVEQPKALVKEVVSAAHAIIARYDKKRAA